MLTLFFRLKFSVCVKAPSRMRNNLSTTSVSFQKKLCRSCTHSKELMVGCSCGSDGHSHTPPLGERACALSHPFRIISPPRDHPRREPCRLIVRVRRQVGPADDRADREDISRQPSAA